MIAVTQYLIRFCVVAPILKIYGMNLQLSEFWFAMLVLSTILIAAGGYAINDYFDTKTDLINRPERVLVGRVISRKAAIWLHFSLSTVGSLLGVATAIYVGEWKFALIFPAVGALLWFYSTTFKSQLLIGNLVISLLVGMVPVMVLLFEVSRIQADMAELLKQNYLVLAVLKYWVSGFALFAFLTNFIREVVKDLEDVEGDAAAGRSTFPISWGMLNTKIIVLILAIIELMAIAVIFYRFLICTTDSDILGYSLGYIAITLILPMLLFIAKLYSAKKPSDFKMLSGLVKMVMLAGILYSIFFSQTVFLLS